MNIEIDQSGKIEDTSKNTIIAYSNGKQKSIFISKQDKRQVQQVFRNSGKSRVFVYKLFSILIFLLIRKDLQKINGIIIDEEYPGQEPLIKDYLLREIRRMTLDFDSHSISFGYVGKKSRAHILASHVSHNKKQPDIVVKTKDVLQYIVK
jgi:hypothetical protein